MLYPPSNKSLAAAESRMADLLRSKVLGHVTGHVSSKQATAYGEQLFGVADTLLASPALLQFCTDQTYSPEIKRQTLDRLFAPQVDPKLISELAELMESRWHRNADLITAVETLGANCVIAAISNERHTRKVEEELFQLATAMKGDPEASDFLSNPNVNVETRVHMVHTLLKGNCDPATLFLAERATINPISGRFRATLNTMVGKIAASRNLAVAKVTSPIELNDHQLKRLEKLLAKKYGQNVEINVSIDPTVLGGLRVEVGDRVLDDTYRARLYDAERRFAEGYRGTDMELTNV